MEASEVPVTGPEETPIAGFIDENGSRRCVACAAANPQEDWTEEDYYTVEQVIEDVLSGSDTDCGLCGLELAGVATEIMRGLA